MNAQFITDANGQRTAVILTMEDYASLIDDLREIEAICADEATDTAAAVALLQAETPPGAEASPPPQEERDEDRPAAADGGFEDDSEA
ncbi:hypothetical protein [Methylogaea oryzae]|uniref:Type II toxin-antitoxin system Phd/YefM family antitoxin n=1 Tax=Methylogaea oryzae TaxID=1295382 RepID=A0A8D5AJ31_9GAMM|nr:hypothetical protein [Methylogaea oryzae]BBL71981.1 hypothetical protein MoryE10_25870 [Methylogaea oryzae]